MLDGRAETQWASGRHSIVVDAPGPPADALDIKLTQFPEDELRMRQEVAGSDQLIGRRRTVLVRLMPLSSCTTMPPRLSRDLNYVGSATARLD
jgi:hypothetical protein